MYTTFFIYGSLLPQFHNHVVIAGHIKSAKKGVVKGRLVDVGDYPALVRDERALEQQQVVHGLWVELPPFLMKPLDELEGFVGIGHNNDYERVWTTDVENTDLSGWVYVWSEDRNCPPCFVNDWYAYKLKDESLRFVYNTATEHD